MVGALLIFSLFIPVEHPIYLDMEEIWVRRGVGKGIFPGTLPVLLDDLPGYELNERVELLRKNFLPLGGGVDLTRDTVSNLTIRTHWGGKMEPLYFYIEPLLSLGEREYPKRKWKDLIAGDIVRAYMMMRRGAWILLIGRDYSKWGETFPHSYIFSHFTPPRDGFKFYYRSSGFSFSYSFQSLGVWPPDIKYYSFERKVHRFLSAHRIEIRPFKGMFLGFSEVALYGGDSRIPDLSYLNPLMLYYVAGFNRRDVNENILWGFDIGYWRKGVSYSGEFIVDDFPYKRVYGETPKIAWNIGVRLTDFLGIKNTFMKLSYSGSTRWTYHHITEWLNYVDLGIPIGHPEGSNFDLFYFYFVKHLKPLRDVGFKLEFKRKGENDPEEAEPVPHGKGEDYFLSGSVSKILEMETFFTQFLKVCRIKFGMGFAYEFNNRRDRSWVLVRMKITIP
jgi:hypothetical protein